MPEEKKEVLTVQIRVVGNQCEAKPPFVAKRKSEVFFDLEESIRKTTTITFQGLSPFEQDVKHGKNKVKGTAAEGPVAYTVKYTGERTGDGSGQGEIIP